MSAAGVLAHGDINAFFGLLLKNVVQGAAIGAHKAFKGLGGLAVGVIGHANGRAGHDILALNLYGIEVFNHDHGAARRAHDAQTAIFQTGFIKGRGKSCGEFRLFGSQKTGGQFFAANFKHKGGHGFTSHPF